MNTTSLPTSGNIVGETQHFTQNASIRPQSPTYHSPMVPRIHLPDPPPLYPSLIAIGAEERTAKEMEHAYNARALELRSYYEKSISNAFAALKAEVPFPHESENPVLDAFVTLYLTKVNSWIEDGVAAYKCRRKTTKQSVSDVTVPRNTNPRRAFNVNYVPLLEHFFDENPFPTHADKVFLAKKSGMTYRQIHVWFQNRRNRTKRPSRTWRKKLACENTIVPLGSLRKRMGEHTVQKKESLYPPLEVVCSSQSDKGNLTQEKRSSAILPHHVTPPVEGNVLDRCAAPLHAFPSPYPPVCAYEPFLLGSRGQMFSGLQWMRRPNHDTSSQSSKTDIDELADQFALLAVRDIHSRRSQRNYGSMQESLAATYSITVNPPPAPHPSLIRPTEVVSSPVHWIPLPIVRASQPAPQAFTESMASYSLNTTSSRRKASPSLKWYPRQPPHPCCSMMKAVSDVLFSAPSPCSLPSSWDSVDSEGETSSPATYLGPLTPHSLSPQPETCSTTLEDPASPCTFSGP